MIVDHEARERLASALGRFLGDEIGAFQFDDEINDIDTNDETAKEVRRWLWYFYDDVQDHKVAATKEQWDFFQRLLLILQSDARIEITRRRKWTVRQFAAVALLLLLGFSFANPLFRDLLFFSMIPFNVAAWVLLSWDSAPSGEIREKALAPFSSVTELMAVRRLVPGFSKSKYPAVLRSRRIRGGFARAGLNLIWFGLLGSLWLPFLAIPEDCSVTRVVPA